MILDLFALILILALVLIVLGFVFKDWSAISLVGFSIIFILSIVILNSGLQYESGATILTNITTSVTTVSYNYIDWSDSNTHTIGYLLSVVGLIGMVFILWGTGLGHKWVSVLRSW